MNARRLQPVDVELIEGGGGIASPVVVLQSDRKPGPTVRFVDQVVSRAPRTVAFRFFSWRTALFSKFDVFHVHWPEFLVRADHLVTRCIKTILTIVLLARLTLRRIPVVRTVHNTSPHSAGSWIEKFLLSWLDRLVTDYVVLNDATRTPQSARRHLIAHGHYESVFAGLPASPSTSNDLITIGRIEPYKGVDVLIKAFTGMPGDFRLHVVGRGDPALVSQLAELAGADSRIQSEFSFVTDADLVRRVTSAEVVVLPYREIHNSGVALVALSLGRPIIARESDATLLLREEVGDGWVHLFDGDLTSTSLAEVLSRVQASAAERAQGPDLSERDWGTVGRKYADVFVAATGPSAKRARAVFINPSGQRDNLGDSVLRRPYLSALREIGPLHVYVGRHPDYVSGLGVHPHDRLYASKGRWVLACLSAAVRGHGHFALNAGEIVLDRKYWGIAGWQIPLLALSRLSGGRGIAWGISRRAEPRTAAVALRATLALCTEVTWRDPVSPFEDDAVSMPDWAFTVQGERREDRPRDRLAVAFRGDRPPISAEALAAMKRFAAERSLSLVVVVQVRRDRTYARELARALDAEMVDWPDDVSHAEQERALRVVYSRTDTVVSDRIHALIIGATEGAIPVGFASTTDEKIVRTFRAVTDVEMSTYARSELHGDLGSFLARVRAHGPQLIADVRAARDEITSKTAATGRSMATEGSLS